MRLIPMVGRALLAPVFIYGGWDVLRNPEGRIKVAQEAGTPQPEIAVRMNAAVMVGAGTLLLLGILPRLAAAALAAALAPTTLAGHPFWKKEGAERKQHVVHFLKNLATIGGLLLVAASSRRDKSLGQAGSST